MKRYIILGTLIGLVIGFFIVKKVQAQSPEYIEAAEYDPTGNRWFISNASSLLETSDGGATFNYFGSATASHGMEVVDGMLIAIGNNVIRAYDLETAEELGSFSIPGSAFLNGMGSRSGEVIVSDFPSGKLYRVSIADPSEMTSEIFVANTGTQPNGIVIDEANNRAIIVNWGNDASIMAADLDSGELTTLVENTGMGNLDGIDIDGDGSFYVSSWSPARITKFSNDFSESETVVQGADSGLSNPADISYSIETDTLGVANSGNGVATFHYFGDASDVAETPLTIESVQWDGSQFTLACEQAGVWYATAFDFVGKKLHEVELSIPGAPTTVGINHLGGTKNQNCIWTFVSPSHTRHSIKLGLRQP
jgi:hypothetical protein